MLVKDIDVLNKIGASRLIYLLISNWSNGLLMKLNVFKLKMCSLLYF